MLTQDAALQTSHALKKWTLTLKQACDVECLLNGTFAPLTGFHDRIDYESVCNTMRLSNGTLWPIPITLDLPEAFARTLTLGETLLLTHEDNTPLASLTLTSLWQPDKYDEAHAIFGTTDPTHPGVYYLQHHTHPVYVGGPLTRLTTLQHSTFLEHRHTPQQLKQCFKERGWQKIIAFQTRNPMHRAHYELTHRAALATGAHLLLHPVIGMTKPGDIEVSTRMRCYQQLLKYYHTHEVLLSALPLAMRMAGPREAVWHALIRKNYGVTHFIVGRDHAGPGQNAQGQPFYPPYAAQTLLQTHADEIGLEIVPFPALVYAPQRQQFITPDERRNNEPTEELSGTALRHCLATGAEIPEWFTFKEIAALLQAAHPPRHQQGYTILFTGLSGAGKSTLAKALQAYLQETQGRRVSLLDGDGLRKHLSSELGFSAQDRKTHLQRMGFVAAEITKHRGIALCAAIAPYAGLRRTLRETICEQGGFIEIYVSTPFDICQKRDVKGLYQQALRGELTQFTGLQDRYDVPEHPDLTLNTATLSVTESLQQIITTLQTLGYLSLVL